VRVVCSVLPVSFCVHDAVERVGEDARQIKRGRVRTVVAKVSPSRDTSPVAGRKPSLSRADLRGRRSTEERAADTVVFGVRLRARPTAADTIVTRVLVVRDGEIRWRDRHGQTLPFPGTGRRGLVEEGRRRTKNDTSAGQAARDKS